jgi:hypothetical protein
MMDLAQPLEILSSVVLGVAVDVVYLLGKVRTIKVVTDGLLEEDAASSHSPCLGSVDLLAGPPHGLVVLPSVVWAAASI